MTIPAFDTLRFAERLEKVGLPREQAAEFSKALGDFMQERLATKEDLRTVKSELLEKLATKEEMRWLFGIAVTLLVLVMTVFKFLH